MKPCLPHDYVIDPPLYAGQSRQAPVFRAAYRWCQLSLKEKKIGDAGSGRAAALCFCLLLPPRLYSHLIWKNNRTMGEHKGDDNFQMK
jgi:hypothetical protein